MPERAEGLRIRAAVLRAPRGPFTIEEAWLRAPIGDEVLVRVQAAGICHTDVLARDGDIPLALPAVLGHEGCGVVERCGPDVRTLAAGDRVALSFAHCGTCAGCRSARPAYCRSFVELNLADPAPSPLTAADGGPLAGRFFGQSSFATHALVRAHQAVKVDPDLPAEWLAPLGCGVQTGAGCVLNALRVQPGQSFAVFGAGAVGLSAVMAAVIAGAAPIVAVDLVPARLELALALGATHAVDARREDAISRIRAITVGGADASLECTGVEAVAEQAVACLAYHGTCGLIGASPRGARAPGLARELKFGGRSIRGITEGDSDPQRFIPQLARWIADGRLPIGRLVQTYMLEQIDEAVAASLDGRVVKPVLRMPGP